MLTMPISTLDEFVATASAAVEDFGKNPFLRLIDSGDVTNEQYHGWLHTIFHQTFQAPSTFALAGANCDSRLHEVRDYLIEHAEEEKSHWQWVIEDLRSTGYEGPDPRTELPPAPTQDFISFNVYLAVRMPVARLGTAAVLEGIGATYGKRYADKVGSLLSVQPGQLKFAYGHGDTDVGHVADIYRVLSEAELSPFEWAWCTYAAKHGGHLYRKMYEAVVA